MGTGKPDNGQDQQDGGARFERVIGAVVLLCVAILAVQFGLWSYRRFRPVGLVSESNQSALDVGVQFPAVRSTDLGGTALEMQPTEPGTPATVLLLLTTTCPYCRVNVPIWNEIHRSLGDQVRLIGLSLDDLERTRRFAESTRAEFPLFVVEDPREFATELGLHAVPQTLALDTEGVIQGVWGGGLNEDHAASILESLVEIAPELQPAPLRDGGHTEGR